MKSVCLKVLVLAILFLSYGCATIIHGTTQKIPVSSDPSGANLNVIGEATKYNTPCQVELSRREDHLLKFDKEGYDSATVEIKSVLSGAVAGNILAGGLIGWGIDAASGGQNRLIPETGNVTLKANQLALKESPYSTPSSCNREKT